MAMAGRSETSLAVLSARYRQYRETGVEDWDEGDLFGALTAALQSRPLSRSQVVELLGAPESESAVAYDSSGLSGLVSQHLGLGLSLGCLKYPFPARSAESTTLLIVYDAHEPRRVRLVHVWSAYCE